MVTVTLTTGVIGQIARLRDMTTTRLRETFELVMKEKPRSNNRSYLFKRLALKVQEPGVAQALEKAGETKSIKLPAEIVSTTTGRVRDPRLPQPGTVLTKVYKSKTLQVHVRARDFEYEGERYRSLSAIARLVTGTPWNGFLFFNLIPTGRAS